jgi:hypothetical protein
MTGTQQQTTPITMAAAPSRYNGNELVISVAEYRKLLGDEASTDQQIMQRLQYLESLCRDIARFELENYVKSARTK